MIDPSTASHPVKDNEKAIDMKSEIPIPERVFCNVPISVGTSYIAGAGRGTFVLKKVDAGNLIYSIDRPILAAVRGFPS